MKKIYILITGLVLGLMILSGCQKEKHYSSFNYTCSIAEDRPSHNTVVSCTKRIFSDSEITSMIEMLAGKDYKLYDNVPLTVAQIESEISYLETQKQSVPIDLSDYIRFLEMQANQLGANYEPTQLLLEDIPLNDRQKVYVQDSSGAGHLLYIERIGNTFMFYREEGISIIGKGICDQNIMKEPDTAEDSVMEWIYPGRTDITKEIAVEYAELLLGKASVGLDLFLAEPCTIITNGIDRSFGWRLVYTRSINGLQSEFYEGEWYYINPDYPPVTAAPWNLEKCVVVVDAKGICEFYWEGAAEIINETETKLTLSAGALRRIIKETVIDVFTSSIPSGNRIDIQISDVHLGSALVASSEEGTGLYVPAWYVRIRYKWDHAEDLPENWETDSILFNAVTGEYIEPRVTQDKLQQIVGDYLHE